MTRQLDHLILAARDLDKLAKLFGDIGFTVGARNRHTWGTINNLVQFDGTFLELLSVADDFETPAPDHVTAPFAGFLNDYIKEREGTAAFVVEGNNAVNDRARWLSHGFNVPDIMNFGRKGRNAAGEEIDVAFSLAFARSPAIPQTLFFSCHDRYPENFWFAEFQQHSNGVTGVDSVILVADDRKAARRFLSAITGDAAPAFGVHSDTFRSGNARLVTMSAETARRLYGDVADAEGIDAGGIIAIHFTSGDLAKTEAALQQSGVAFDAVDGRPRIGASHAFGTALIFEPQDPAAQDTGAIA